MEIGTHYVLGEVDWDVSNLNCHYEFSPRITQRGFTMRKRLSTESLESMEGEWPSLGGPRSVESGSVLSLLSEEAGVRGGVR